MQQRDRSTAGGREAARYRAVVDNQTEFVVQWLPDGTRTFANAAYLRAFGLTAAQVIGTSFLPLVSEADRPKVEAKIARLVSGAVRSETETHRSVLPGGALAWQEWTDTALTDEHGRVVELLSVGRDVTARHLAETRLRRLSRTYAMLSEVYLTLARAPDSQAMLHAACSLAVDKGGFRMAWIGLVDADSGLVRPVASAGVVDGYLDSLEIDLADSRQRAGPTARVVISGVPAVFNDLSTDAGYAPWREEALSRGYRASASFPLRTGELRKGTLNLYADEPEFFDDDEVRLLGELAANIAFALEVTTRESRRRDMEEALRQAQKMEAVGQLAGGIAHDFNNLLTIIQGNVDLALLDRDHLPEGVEGMLQEVSDAASGAASLTNQLLLLSRKQAFRPSVIDLNDRVASVARMLKRVIGEHITLRLATADTPLATAADPGMIDQVLVNLAINARDAMPAGGTLTIGTEPVTLTDAEAAIAARRATHYVCLRVTDTGVGITPEIRDRIFEPFFTTKPPGKGTGLGLATVFGIVTQHGGWIDLDTGVGRGTTFSVFLPAASEGVTVTGESAAPTRVGAETILLAEDESGVRTLVKAALERHGYTILEARSGADALAVFERHAGRIDLLFSDVVMPGGMSGYDLAARLRARAPDLRVLLTSGYTPEAIRPVDSVDGGDPVLQKPAPLAQLLQAVRNVLDR